MKKIFLIALLIIVCLMGCQKIGTANEQSMFVEVGYGDCCKIYYHRDTKVMYICSCSPYNYGSYTVMLDANGKPLLWDGGE